MIDGPDYVVIGHVTDDLQPDGQRRPGGTVLFAGITAARLGRRVGIVTAATSAEPLQRALPTAQIICQPSARTTTFVNQYATGQRTQHLLAAADPINLAIVPAAWWQSPVVHLGPLTQEIAPTDLARLAPGPLYATPQGWLRRWDPDDGLVSLGPPEAADFATVPLTVLVLSEGAEEACSAALIAQVLARPSGLVVITRGARGSTLLAAGGQRDIPTYPVDEIDPTGAGDVFAAALFCRLAAGDEPPTAAAYASAAGALCVTGPGATTVPDDAAIRRLISHSSPCTLT